MSTFTRSSLLSLVALSGCWWTAPENDAGDESFVAQSIELVLGRKPRGAAEVRALTEVVGTHGRPALLQLLFAQPEYVSYWSNVLADDLEVQRSGYRALDVTCTAPALLPPGRQEALALHLTAAPPDEQFCVWKPRSPDGRLYDPTRFQAAVDAAMANYDGTPLDQLPVPEALSEVPAYEYWGNAKPESEPSTEPNLRLWGAGATNQNFSVSTGSASKTEWDAQRWLGQRERAGSWDCPPFNLTDVLEGAVRADRLDAAYRAYLPVFAWVQVGGIEQDKRAWSASMFLDVYLDRDPTCMVCHTSTWSKTDAMPRNGNWDRFEPIWFGLPAPIDAEGTVFSYDVGTTFEYGGNGGSNVRSRVESFFRSDNFGDGAAPWGIEQQCVPTGMKASLPPDATAHAAFAGVGPATDVGVVDLLLAWSDAVSSLDEPALERTDWAAYRAAKRGTVPAPASEPTCTTGCHGRMMDAPPLEHLIPTMTDVQLHSVIRQGSGTMPAQYGTDPAAWDAVEWLRTHYPRTPALELQDRGHAWIHLVAANIVNQVVDETLGEDLVMTHGFPRNQDQAQALSHLTQTFTQRFSLKDLLSEIVLSDGFNRKPPDAVGTIPYNLPMLPYPEAGVAPRTPVPLGGGANSEGDFVHRVSPSGLFHQVHHALGWPEATIGNSPSMYPRDEVTRSTGRYAERTMPEQPHFGLVSYLTWEQEVATCKKPELVYAKDVTLVPGVVAPSPDDAAYPEQWVDWIDELVTTASARGDTWEQLAVAIKDRLLADPVLAPEEATRIAALWEVDLGDSPGADGVIDLAEENALRSFCGVLMTTPHFVLRGLRLADDLPTTLPTPVCLPEEACGVEAIRDEATATLDRLGIAPSQ